VCICRPYIKMKEELNEVTDRSGNGKRYAKVGTDIMGT
jgi:hypothetical protein